jgi:hypothetical protein
MYSFQLGDDPSCNSHGSALHVPASLPPSPGCWPQIWDLGGQQGLRPFWATYFKKTDAVVMVVDSTDRARVGVAKVREPPPGSWGAGAGAQHV